MSERTRRTLLAGVAAGTVGLAGCTGLAGNGAEDTGTSTLTPAEVPTTTPSPTPGPDTLGLTRVEGVVDGRTVVYPDDSERGSAERRGARIRSG